MTNEEFQLAVLQRLDELDKLCDRMSALLEVRSVDRRFAEFVSTLDGARDLSADDYIDLMMRMMAECDRRATAISRS